MLFGLFIFATEFAIGVDELAREAEQRGFESLFVPEHTHIPKSRRTPWRWGPELPPEYSHTHDPFVALATAAAVTTRLKVGTGICLITERDPIITAKAVASLDVLSSGRFLFGIGVGWIAEEMENHGTEYTGRFRLLRERVLAMKEIWTKEEPEFHGEFVNFDPIWSYPKPIQKPYPPILLGGESEHTRRRVVEFCDGWFPRGRRSPDLAADIRDLRAQAEAAGQRMETLSVSVFGASPDAATIESYAAAGVTRAVFGLPSKDRETVLPLLDQYARFIR